MAKIFQYLAAFSICIGALCTGILIAWTSNIGPKLKDGDLNDLEFTDTDFSIFGAMMCLGAACTCIPVGFLLNILGRKLTLFLTVIPFTIGWALLYFASHMAITFVARFILGLAGGSFCIGAPLYNMEIADTKSRGMMGTFFQLFITIGIFFAQVMGYMLSVQAYLIVCAIIPFIFLICFALQPESPVFLVKKEKIEKAEKALKRLRNEDDNIADEMKQLQTNAAKEIEMKGKCKETMSHKATKKATFICMMLMVFQQFTGINAIMFYTETIFSCANIEVNSALQTITVGLVQIIATLVSAVTIDKFGRKLLFLVSTSMMAVGVFLSLIFYIPFVYNISSESANEKLAWFPLIGIWIYIVGFSLGMGPIPWMAAGELVPVEVKPQIAAAAGTLNWFCAFLITLGYPIINEQFKAAIPFIFFFIMCIVCIAFTLIFFIETKNKDFNEIYQELGGD